MIYLPTIIAEDYEAYSGTIRAPTHFRPMPMTNG